MSVSKYLVNNSIKKCSICDRGYVIASMSASYYYCNNCYKYAGDIKKTAEVIRDVSQVPLFSGMTNEEVEELLNGLLGLETN